MERLVFIVASFAATVSPVVVADTENPTVVVSEHYVLKVPIVDFLGTPGFYQDAVFERQPSDGSWKLLSYVQSSKTKFVTTVEVTKTTEVPAQVFLKVNGILPDSCSKVGRAAVSQIGNEFKVAVYYDNAPLGPVECLSVERPFSKVVPLPVYGLNAGEYGFSVNNTINGTFMLTVNNVLP